MTIEEMINLINVYLSSGDLKDPKWIITLEKCKELLLEQIK